VEEEDAIHFFGFGQWNISETTIHLSLSLTIVMQSMHRMMMNDKKKEDDNDDTLTLKTKASC